MGHFSYRIFNVFKGCTLLIDAIKRGDGFTSKFLLEKGCDVDLIDRDSADTALHLVSTYSENSCDFDTCTEMVNVQIMYKM